MLLKPWRQTICTIFSTYRHHGVLIARDGKRVRLLQPDVANLKQIKRQTKLEISTVLLKTLNI